MPSIADIPEHLKQPNQRMQFILWLSKAPLSQEDSFWMMGQWTKITGAPFDAEHWTAIAQEKAV